MNTSPIYDRVNKDLSKRHEQDLFRSIRSAGIEMPIDLSTNSYLALHAEPEIIQHALELTGDNFYGNLASRLVMESSPLYAVPGVGTCIMGKHGISSCIFFRVCNSPPNSS